jgi:hypothetical protein
VQSDAPFPWRIGRQFSNIPQQPEAAANKPPAKVSEAKRARTINPFPFFVPKVALESGKDADGASRYHHAPAGRLEQIRPDKKRLLSRSVVNSAKVVTFLRFEREVRENRENDSSPKSHFDHGLHG